MRKSHVCRRMSVLAIIVSCSMLLSACDLLGGSSNETSDETNQDETSSASIEKAIQGVVEDYLDDVRNGTLADDDYESDYTDDTPFADLSFMSNDSSDEDSDEDSEEDSEDAADPRIEIMSAAFDAMSYEIEDVEGSTKDEEGSCDVTITAVDIEKVLSDFDEGVDAKALLEAISDKDAPTEDYDITFDMSYDPDEEEWIISDSSPLCEILGEPFEDVELMPDSASLLDTVDAFMTALAEGDADTIDSLSPYYDSTYFWMEDDDNALALANAFYKSITYEFVGEPDIYDGYADVNLSVSMVDFEALFTSVAEDVDFNAEILKPYILAIYEEGDTTAAYNAYLSAYIMEVAARIEDSDAPYTSLETYMSLELDSDTNTWELYSIPYELYSITYYGNSDPYYYSSEESNFAGYVLAAEMLYNEGSIDLATYEYYLSDYGGTTEAIYNSADVFNDIVSTEWFDYNTYAGVTSYDATNTYYIEHDIYFNLDWTGLVVYYEFYNSNGTIVCKSSSETMQAGDTYVGAYYSTEDYSLIPADTYRVVIYLEDGTILAEESVTVS